MLPQSCDVLIVGAGPAGMALSITLAQSGIRPVVVERAATQQTTSRAAVIHSHTLEVLEHLGVADRMLIEGKRLGKFAFRDRDRLLGMIRFDDLPSKHRCLLMLPQDRTEAIMLDRLTELGVEIVRGVTFAGMKDEGGRVAAVLDTASGRRTLSARFLVGADGMHSAVRAACSIPFDGAQYEESFVLADVTFDTSTHRDEVSLFFSPDGLVVVAPLQDERYRIVATVDESPEKPDARFMQALLDARGPTSPGLGRIREVVWSSRFRLHHRLARHYRRGRVFILGDAAHVHSPAGGQGMNTGLVDAFTLGRLLAEVLLGRADEASLARYERLRRPAAARVLALAGRLTRAATLRSRRARTIRNLVLSVLARLPGFRRRLAMNLSGLARRSATYAETYR